ncbi:MAG: PEP/pyruvate-binding domain-containing protein [Dissulfurispiraceae bacterium]
MAPDNKVISASKYHVLQEVVENYPGLFAATSKLISDLNQSQRDWVSIMRQVRTYSLRNFSFLNHHDRGVEAVKAILEVFLEALHSGDLKTQQSTIENLMLYIEKILTDCHQNIHKYLPAIEGFLTSLAQLSEEQFLLLVRSPYHLRKLGQLLMGKISRESDIKGFNDILFRSLLVTYDYWLNQQDPVKWFRELAQSSLKEEELEELEIFFYPVSHSNLRGLRLNLGNMKGATGEYERLQSLLKLPSYQQLVGSYEDIIGALGKNPGLKLKYLLKIAETEGLASIHERTLREINRTLLTVIRMKPPNEFMEMLSETFEIFKKVINAYPETTLNCIQCVGNEIFNEATSNIVEWFIQKIISLGFQYPRIEGASNEWQVRANKAHLQNIRVWLELIENKPKWSKTLISTLIVNLSLGGVQVNDTDLFQRDISKLLNSDIKPVYHLVKRLARLFPIYFNEINAEGDLRQVSTELDEIAGRADILIHFLRKQSHVESSARIVEFIEEIIHFWITKDKEPLRQFLPEDVFHQVMTSGRFVDDISAVINVIFRRKEIKKVIELLPLSEDEIRVLSEDSPEISRNEKRRAYLIIRFYQLLHRKYVLSPQDTLGHLRYAQHFGLPVADSLIAVLEKGTLSQRLEEILKYLQLLQDIILSPDRYVAVEDIFHRRHIAAGIPSMSGRYLEKKFDAISLTFRLENLANILFDELVNSAGLQFITRADLFQIEKNAKLFFNALKLEGISSHRLENTLELLSGALEVRRFTASQYIDVFRGFAEAVQDILNTYYSGIYKSTLKNSILQMGTEDILSKYLDPHKGRTEFEFINTISERFLREIVATTLGLQQLDNFISKILNTLFEQSEGLSVQNLDLLMSYDPKKALCSLHAPNENVNDRIHLGNKGYTLLKLASLGLPVPPGFIITSEVFRCLPAITGFYYAREHLNKGIREEITRLERLTGKILGDPENPLLVSVRSGASISMPGMMNSVLNVGINEAIVEGLIRQTAKPWFVWDCYRRFLQSWGMSFGIERDKFDVIINFFKRKYKVSRKIQFTPGQMKEVASAYRSTVINSGIAIIDDPKDQLEIAIAQVFQSWFSKTAQAYREILGISENWGTAIIVQVMVYGNLDTSAGTGVVFTRNPRDSGDKVVLWGDFTTGAQGEDIVSGLVETLPISNEQNYYEERHSDTSLEDSSYHIYGSLLRMIKRLIYDERWGAQEIEFTFEGNQEKDLYILQARDMTVVRRESFIAFVPSAELASSYLSSGIGVGGGALSGRVVFGLEDVQNFREKDATVPLILIRSDTVPDDIRHISAAEGLLTSRGGSTSHAAIIANRLGKTCVVGCNKLYVSEHERKCKINKRTVRVGDFISIDGRNGSVYLGAHQAKEIKPLTE